MSDDIIRIDGVEYEAIRIHPLVCGQEAFSVSIRPKRKQTGWICRECNVFGGCCLEITNGQLSEHNAECTAAPKWQPFYGKVVDNDG